MFTLQGSHCECHQRTEEPECIACGYQSRRFFLASDGDGHWFIVPSDKADEWEEWSNLSDDDERKRDAPSFAQPLGGCPAKVTFCYPQDVSA
ncbi:hypothetical protein N9260_01320 [bacterium]|nr:hypothetical protein [bacterium]